MCVLRACRGPGEGKCADRHIPGRPRDMPPPQPLLWGCCPFRGAGIAPPPIIILSAVTSVDPGRLGRKQPGLTQQGLGTLRGTRKQRINLLDLGNCIADPGREKATHILMPWGHDAHIHSGWALLSPPPFPLRGYVALPPGSGSTGPSSPLPSSFAARPPSLPQG